MLDLKNILVRSLDPDREEIFWEVEPTHLEVWDYTFQILRSEAQSGPYEELSPPFEDRYRFVDVMTQPFDKWRKLFYKVRVTRKLDGEQQDFGPSTHEPQVDLIGLNIQLLERTLLRQHTGRVSWLFPKRTFGTRCQCYDPVMKRKMRSRCVTCFDTAFVRGFHRPIEFYCQFFPTPQQNFNTQSTQAQPVQGNARLGNFPYVKPGDMLVEAENRRWKVTAVQNTEKLRARIRQDVIIREIATSDVEYRVPVKIDDVMTIEPTEAREFTRPQDIDGRAVDAAFEFYRQPGVRNI